MVADFRREYGLSLDAALDLEPVEFAALVHGLSADSRVVFELGRSATVESELPPDDVDEFVAQLQRHPGMKVEVIRVG